jgi:hypothetical protein
VVGPRGFTLLEEGLELRDSLVQPPRLTQERGQVVAGRQRVGVGAGPGPGGGPPARPGNGRRTRPACSSHRLRFVLARTPANTSLHGAPARETRSSPRVVNVLLADCLHRSVEAPPRSTPHASHEAMLVAPGQICMQRCRCHPARAAHGDPPPLDALTDRQRRGKTVVHGSIEESPVRLLAHKGRRSRSDVDRREQEARPPAVR